MNLIKNLVIPILLFALLVIVGCEQLLINLPTDSSTTTTQEATTLPEPTTTLQETTTTLIAASTTSIPPPSTCSPDYDGVCPAECTTSNDNDCCRKKECYGWVPNQGCKNICQASTTIPPSITSSSTTTTTLDKFRTTTTTTTSTTLSTTTTIQQASCSAVQDNLCPLGCSALNDYDCCINIGYCWHETLGCRSVCL